MSKVLILNGPNLNMLGKREPEIYGHQTLEDVEVQLRDQAEKAGWVLDFIQSNHEGVLVDILQQANGQYHFIVFNPAAYTHYSIALRDVIAGIDVPVIEVHISPIYQREDFRHHSVLAPVCYGQISGFGILSYQLALQAGISLFESNSMI